jgi:RHS repeat-associated protein
MFYSLASNPVSQFTGKERDAETGLDYFGGRYFSGAEGRFISPDPKASSARLYDPQRWNRYTYALNNPLYYIDPDGEEVRVYTERLGTATVGFISSLFRPRHSFMRVTTPSDDVVLELGGPTQKTKPKGNPIKTKVGAKYDPHRGRKSVNEASVQRPDGVGSNDYSFEYNILDTFDRTKDTLPDYDWGGPNSNGFIQYLIESAGGEVDLPNTAVAHHDTEPYRDAQTINYYDDPNIQSIQRMYDLPMVNNDAQRALEIYNSNFIVVWQ